MSSYLVAISLAGTILVDQDHIGVLVNRHISLHVCTDVSVFLCCLRRRNVSRFDNIRISLSLYRYVTWIKFTSSSSSHLEANVFKIELT